MVWASEYNKEYKLRLFNLVVVERVISFDARFDGRKGDEIKIVQGWRNLNGVRANNIENITSGNTNVIARGMMLDPPKELDPPLCGKVISVRSVGSGSQIVVEEIIPGAISVSSDEEKEYDFFISHATEDKESFVAELAGKLSELGITVWYDDSRMDWGHDLRPNIDNGLSKCKYGIVVLSKAFLGKKKWTEYELNSLFAQETVDKRMVLPIWHNINKDDVLKYSPILADRIALRSDDMNQILKKCASLSGKDFEGSENSNEDDENEDYQHLNGTMTYDKIMERIGGSRISDWEHDDIEGVFIYKPDVNLTIKRASLDMDNVFPEPWSKKFPDRKGHTIIYNIFYGNSFIKKEYIVGVDGFRGYIPYPEDGYSDNPKLTKWAYKFGEIIHSKVGFSGSIYSYDNMLKRANISVIQ